MSAAVLRHAESVLNKYTPAEFDATAITKAATTPPDAEDQQPPRD
jgi:hypothetical protein